MKQKRRLESKWIIKLVNAILNHLVSNFSDILCVNNSLIIVKGDVNLSVSETRQNL